MKAVRRNAERVRSLNPSHFCQAVARVIRVNQTPVGNIVGQSASLALHRRISDDVLMRPRYSPRPGNFRRSGMNVRELFDLAAVLRRERETLLAVWRAQVRQLPSARDLDVPTLNDHVPALIDELVEAIES